MGSRSGIPKDRDKGSISDFDFGSFDDLFAECPDMNIFGDIDDILEDLPDLRECEILLSPLSETIVPDPFAIHVCRSEAGAPPRLVIDDVKLPEPIDDTHPEHTLELAKSISTAAVAAHKNIDRVPCPSKEATPFAIGAVVLGADHGVTSVSLDISPHPGGKTQLGTGKQRKSIFTVLGTATWYVGVFAEYNVLFITSEPCLKHSLIEKLHLRCNTPATVVFFRVVYNQQKQISLAAGKYIFLFDKSSDVHFASPSSTKRKREASILSGFSLRSCIIGSTIDISKVASLLTSAPEGVFDPVSWKKFEEKMTKAHETVAVSMILQLAKFLEDSQIDDARCWVRICGMF